ncbi:MAG: N-acetylmuramoyl-L-alanine amidase [bacterium]
MAERIVKMTNKQDPRLTSLYWNLGFGVMLGCFLLAGLVIFGVIPGINSKKTPGNAYAAARPVPKAPIANAPNNGTNIPAPAVIDGSNSDAENRTSERAKKITTKDTSKLPVICIDPGHPSEVNRATNVQNGLKEVEVVYDVAMKLKAELEDPDDPVARVVMTRNFRSGTGKIVTNRIRAEIANEAGAALLVRLHCDSGKDSGYTIYYPDREGKAQDGKTGPSKKVIADSGKAAKAFHTGMAEIISGIKDNGVMGDSSTFIGSKQGALTGSIYSHVPAITIEMVFLSNAHDAKFIGSDEGQQMMAEALKCGVMRELEEFGLRK